MLFSALSRASDLQTNGSIWYAKLFPTVQELNYLHEVLFLDGMFLVMKFATVSTWFKKEIQASDEDKISFAFHNALTREPSDDEIKVIQKLLKNQRQRYKEDNKSAIDLLKTGMSKYDPSIEVSELAAWTSISRSILNMYETTARL